MTNSVAIAIGAHPDDIEFHMAGTLLLLKHAGFATHYLSVASGNCGSTEYNASTTRAIRSTEARAAAKILGAVFHASLCDDLEVFYTAGLLRSLAAVIRDVKPVVVLTHSPQDYMEDHANTCRLVVTSVFARAMSNFKTTPSRPASNGAVTVYHAMPQGLRDGLRRRVIPGAFVNTTSVQTAKREALAAHKSQQHWLDVSQGLNSYLLAMEEMSRDLGRLSRKFQHAEGWRRHLHLGFCAPEADPMAKALGAKYLVNAAYERDLEDPLG